MSKRCQKLWDDLEIGTVTVLKFDAEMVADDDESPGEDSELAPVTPKLWMGEDHIFVLLETKVRTEHLRIHTVMYAPFSGKEGGEIDVDPTDEELLVEFARWAAERVLVPRTEAVAAAADGLIGPMRRLPTAFLGKAELLKPDLDDEPASRS